MIGPNDIESSSKLLKQTPVENLLYACSFIKKSPQLSYFPVIFVKFFRTPVAPKVFSQQLFFLLNSFNSAHIFLLQVSNRNTRKKCEICSELTVNTAERRYWRCFGAFIVKFGHISHVFPVFLLLNLNR